MLDLGCGEAGWLRRALELHPDATADGVDTSVWSLGRAADAAAEQGVADRLTLHETDVDDFPVAADFDLVLCVGATHAFGGLASTLVAAGGRVRPDGFLLVGEGFWETPPGPPALEALGADAGDLLDLVATLDLVERSGWTPVHGHVSSAHEWDDYEWSWCGSLASWALDHPEDPDAPDALTISRDHRQGWLGGYRGVLGFVCLLLRRSTP